MKAIFITSQKHLEIFSSKCGRKMNLAYPMAFLKNCKVRAFFNKYGAMVGGYIINDKGPFRVIESLPQKIKEHSPWTNPKVLEQSYEVTGLWLDRKIVGRFANFFFWTVMYKDMIWTRKKYFVYAYDLDKVYLKKLYSIVNPTVIFQGVTELQEGMFGECEESVEIASVRYIRLAFFMKFNYFLKKLFVSRRRKRVVTA